MTNIALIIGTGLSGEDILHKLPWIRHLNHNLYIASRINPEIHLSSYSEYILGNSYTEIVNSVEELQNISNEFSIIYESEYLRREYEIEEINSLQKWLGISFGYISSFDRRFYNAKKKVDKRNYNELYNYMACLVEFFRNFFVKNKVDVFINTIEDDAVSVVAYYVAKKLNIKIIGFMFSRFPNRGVLFCEDFKNICIFNKDKLDFEKIMSMYDTSTIAGKHTQEKNENYWKITSIMQRFHGIYFMWKNSKYFKYIIKNYKYEKLIFKNTSLIVEIKKYFTKFSRYIFVRRILKNPNENKYFLFPLHYLDDAQITFREPLLEQFTLISNISRALPKGCFLYVKPHPHYLGTDVSFRDLLTISRLKNVKIINPVVPPLNLIKNSLGVITVNSTTGFEALIMGIPVLTFGHDFYCKPHYCHVITDLNDLSESLLSMLDKHEFDEEVRMDFIKTIYNNTIWISNSKYENIFALTDDEGKRISDALDTILINENNRDLYENIKNNL